MLYTLTHTETETEEANELWWTVSSNVEVHSMQLMKDHFRSNDHNTILHKPTNSFVTKTTDFYGMKK